MVTALTTCQALKAENQRIKDINPKESIWLMKKAELVEVAMAELGFTRSQAQEKTVGELKERLKQSRKEHKEAEDPFLKPPPKMEKMLAADLVKECTKRGISVAPLPGEKGDRQTRPQMMLAIRNDVARRLTRVGEEDWQMTDATTHEDGDHPPRTRPRGSASS